MGNDAMKYECVSKKGIKGELRGSCGYIAYKMGILLQLVATYLNGF